MVPRTLLFTLACVAMLLSSCARKPVSQATAPSPTLRNDSYLDLKAGTQLRIVLPIWKTNEPVSPATAPSSAATQPGETIVLSASNLAGYSTYFYTVEKQASGRVRLRFRRGEVSRNGQITALPDEPRLPFALPVKSEYIRLVFLVRAAATDHNMAILASRSLTRLQTLTATLGRDPSACQTDSQAFCSWVPAGIAVRPD